MPTPDPNFVVAPCGPSDIDQMIKVNTRAFERDYLFSHIFPASSVTAAARRDWLYQNYLTSFSKPEIHNFKVVDQSTGDIAAWVRWQFPHFLSEEEKAERKKKEDARPRWPEGANEELSGKFFGTLERFRNQLVDAENMYVVYLLQTDPAYQRKGLGKLLLKHGLDLADSEGRKAYIEASEDGHPVYLKLGFRDVDLVKVDLSKWGGKEPGITWVMVRDPQPI